jgi:hypothetical protein
MVPVGSKPNSGLGDFDGLCHVAVHDGDNDRRDCRGTTAGVEIAEDSSVDADVPVITVRDRDRIALISASLARGYQTQPTG